MKKNYKSLFLLFLATVIMLCTACGEKEAQESTVYYAIVSRTEEIFPVSEDGGGSVIGMQFYQGKPVKLIRTEKYEDGTKWKDYYLCEADGSQRLLLKDAADFLMQGFVDREGNFYSIQPAETSGTGADFRYDLVKWDGTGQKLFRVTLDLPLGYMGQLDSGDILLKPLGGAAKLLNAQTGELADVGEPVRSALEKALFVIGTDGNSMIAADSKEVWKIDVYTGMTEPLLTCVGTTYELMDLMGRISDCKNSGEGELSFLYQSSSSGEGTLETLARADIGEGRTPVVLRGMHFTNNSTGQWLKERIVDFNDTNEKYFVVLEECPDGTAEEDYARMTGVEIAAKKGPDILMGSAFDEYIQGMIEKGAFEELSGYMKKSGIREEDFFPGTFACYRSGKAVYSVVPTLLVNGYMIKREVLDSDETPNVKELVQALLAYPEPALYWTESSDGIVRQLLCGSENLWGMIDRKAGTCDFHSALFYGILETAEKYGFVLPAGTDSIDANWLREENTLAVEDDYCWNLYNYKNHAEMEREGMLPFGVLFDEGCFAMLSDDVSMMVNHYGEHKDGAWEFLCFLLREETQERGRSFSGGYPANKAAFENLLSKERAEGPVKRKVTGGAVTAGDGKPLTEQDMEEMRQILEEARYPVFQTEEILDIICEEAQVYFDGVKSVEQVADVIENRVELYLKEHK